jgi:hypothetical protein
VADLKGCRAGKTSPTERIARRLADREAAFYARKNDQQEGDN